MHVAVHRRGTSTGCRGAGGDWASGAQPTARQQQRAGCAAKPPLRPRHKSMKQHARNQIGARRLARAAGAVLPAGSVCSSCRTRRVRQIILEHPQLQSLRCAIQQRCILSRCVCSHGCTANCDCQAARVAKTSMPPPRLPKSASQEVESSCGPHPAWQAQHHRHCWCKAAEFLQRMRRRWQQRGRAAHGCRC